MSVRCAIGEKPTRRPIDVCSVSFSRRARFSRSRCACIYILFRSIAVLYIYTFVHLNERPAVHTNIPHLVERADRIAVVENIFGQNIHSASFVVAAH